MILISTYQNFLNSQKKINNLLGASFNLIVSAGEAKVTAPLSPTLGQFGVSCQDFCNRFNAETSELYSGLPIRILFDVFFKERDFRYTLLGVSFTKIIRSAYTEKLLIKDIYSIYLSFVYLYGHNFRATGSVQIKNILSVLRGFFKSLHLTTVIFF